jgi:hypothetical protein
MPLSPQSLGRLPWLPRLARASVADILGRERQISGDLLASLSGIAVWRLADRSLLVSRVLARGTAKELTSTVDRFVAAWIDGDEDAQMATAQNVVPLRLVLRGGAVSVVADQGASFLRRDGTLDIIYRTAHGEVSVTNFDGEAVISARFRQALGRTIAVRADGLSLTTRLQRANAQTELTQVDSEIVTAAERPALAGAIDALLRGSGFGSATYLRPGPLAVVGFGRSVVVTRSVPLPAEQAVAVGNQHLLRALKEAAREPVQ